MSEPSDPILGRWSRLPLRLQRIAAAAIPTGLVAAHAARYGAWIIDDAAITFSYARSIATGAGPVLQRGAAPVEGFSNPTWTAILVVGRWLRLFDSGTWFGVPNLVWFPKLVALLCCFGIFWCFHALVAAVRARGATLVTVAAGAVTALVPSFVIWTMSGLENSLFALAVAALASLLVRRTVSGSLLSASSAVGSGAFVALAALTRPDGLIYLAAYPIVVLVVSRAERSQRIRAILLSTGTALAPVAAFEVWRLAEFGHWLPNTAVAKQQGLPGLSDLNKPTEVFGYLGWLGVVLLVVMTAMALRGDAAVRSSITVLLVPLGLALLAFAVLEHDWMAQLRFTTPVWPLASLILALSVAEVVPRIDGRMRFAVIALVAVSGLVTLDAWTQRSDEFIDRPTGPMCAVARHTGYTFNTYADRLGIDEGSLLAVDGGATALTSRLRFVDLSGLTDARIARYWSDDDMAGLRDHIFDDVRPTFIRIWSGWAEAVRSGVLDDPRLRRDYVVIWSSANGSSNWVRREAVKDDAKLVGLQKDAQHLMELVEAPWPKGMMRWWCGADLRPTPIGDDPVTKLPT